MTRTEMNKWFTEIKLITSTLFNRKCQRAIIGAEPNVWYFTNIDYKRDDVYSDSKDELYMYSPTPKHYVHAVRMFTEGRFAELVEMFKFVEERNLLLALLLDKFNQAFSDVLKLKAEDYTYAFSMKNDTLMLNISMNNGKDKKSYVVGYFITLQHTELIRDIMMRTEARLKEPRMNAFDITNAHVSTSEFSIVPADINKVRLSIPLMQGDTVVAKSYRVKTESPGRVVLKIWPVGGVLWDTAVTFHDDNVDIVSYHMNKVVFALNGE